MGRRKASKAWLAQPPSTGVIRSVAEKPPLATLVGMWLIDSIRSIWRLGARLRLT